MRLEGKVAAVTGGGSGIGEAIAIRLSEEGARVAVLDINESAAQLTAGMTEGGVGMALDVRDSAAVDAVVARIESELGPLDIWVNNAGISGPHADLVNERAQKQLDEMMSAGTVTTPLDSLITVEDEHWADMLAVHLNGTFYGSRAAARVMVPRRSGAIVNIGSICGLEGCTGHPQYSAAKGGIIAFTRTCGKELASQGIRMNVIAPGFIRTPLIKTLSESLMGAIAMQTPMGRLGTPQEIAATVAFLASDDSSFYAGATLSPNGGFVTAV